MALHSAKQAVVVIIVAKASYSGSSLHPSAVVSRRSNNTARWSATVAPDYAAFSVRPRFDQAHMASKRSGCLSGISLKRISTSWKGFGDVLLK